MDITFGCRYGDLAIRCNRKGSHNAASAVLQYCHPCHALAPGQLPAGILHGSFLALYMVAFVLHNAVHIPSSILGPIAFYSCVMSSGMCGQLDLVVLPMVPPIPCCRVSGAFLLRAASLYPVRAGSWRRCPRERFAIPKCCAAHLIPETVCDFHEPAPHSDPQPSLIRGNEWRRVQGWIDGDLRRMRAQVPESIDCREDDPGTKPLTSVPTMVLGLLEVNRRTYSTSALNTALINSRLTTVVCKLYVESAPTIDTAISTARPTT